MHCVLHITLALFLKGIVALFSLEQRMQLAHVYP
jgi:hypothetical protein